MPLRTQRKKLSLPRSTLMVLESLWAKSTKSRVFPVRALIHTPLSRGTQFIYVALKWFDAAGKDEPYEAGRDLDSLAALYVASFSTLSQHK